MEARTLVLTPWMQVHDTMSWKASIVLVVDQKVDVLETHDGTITTAGNRYEFRPPLVLEVPAVVRLRKMDRMYRDGVKFSRSNVYSRDRCRCCYCGRTFRPEYLNYDHVLPRSRGGKTDFRNIVTTCFPCNTRKDNRTPEEAGMKMLYQPHQPTSLSGARPMRLDLERVPTCWLPYIDPTAGTQVG
jgi:5-methylcytosine-specific restriction endonuclease McrA